MINDNPIVRPIIVRPGIYFEKVIYNNMGSYTTLLNLFWIEPNTANTCGL